MKQPTITVYRDSAGQWRWRLQTANSRVIADSSEGYASRRNAIRAALTLVGTAARAIVLA